MARKLSRVGMLWVIICSTLIFSSMLACGYHLAFRRDGVHIIPEPNEDSSSPRRDLQGSD